MSAPARPSHNWKRPVETKAEDDPLDRMISRTGCVASHHAMQECMAEHQDWRRCQPQVQAFRACMNAHQQRRHQELQQLQEQQKVAQPGS
ncbi:cytochrome c oxidase assembly factor 4 homolog, mitochondrial-like [Tachyglossus aculeatus]|uniref:cytochrome c oxidase assembly factor 4 homolog, mitochondrial-like n=1 Tax=Tachyglossus aculeatus TaxID=9261 RepID=UPI0018F5FA94|nr:cytochrome c oxidase assembly factor 4 homolog, mitochondrial-like [Tachyglossus aculeatus]